MKLIQLLILLTIIVPTYLPADNYKEYRVILSPDDSFIIKDTKEFTVTLKEQLILRFATVVITPRKGDDFSLMLFFKYDDPDLALFDSPQEMQMRLRRAAMAYMPHVVETEVTLQEFSCKNRHGYLTILTDRMFVNKKVIPAGNFKYLTKGILRISTDSMLGFSLMTNEIDTRKYNHLLTYVKSFAKD